MRTARTNLRSLADQLAWEVRRRFKSTYLKPETFLLQLCLWPLIGLLTMVLCYAPFTGSRGFARVLPFTGGLSLGAYLLLGTFAVGIFAEYVIAAFILALERDQGTLEAVYLTPASRLVYLTGSALGSALAGTASLLGYVCLGLILFRIRLSNPPLVALAACLVLLTSLPWGTFLAAIFLVGRNSRVLYALFERPAEFLSGVRFPVTALPAALHALSSAYPITHAVSLLRAAASPSPAWAVLCRETVWLVALAAVYLAAAGALAAFAERRGKVHGTLSYS